MKKLSLILMTLLCGCSVIQPVEHKAPQIHMKEGHYILDRSEEGLKKFYEVIDEEGVEVEVNVTFDENDVLCVDAVNEYGKSANVCKQYEAYDLEFDYDYENSSLDTILQTYMSDKNISDDIYYFYYNTVTEEQFTYRENEVFLAASTIKVPMCIAWTDLIQEGILSYDSTLYYDPSLYEASGYDLTNFYPIGSRVPLSLIMENSIVYSDNSCANMMLVYYNQYKDQTFREWLAQYSPTDVSNSFYHSNEATAGLMLNVMKKLYSQRDQYQKIIEDMKVAAEGEYMQLNDYPFDVAQKYGDYSIYEHTMGIMFTNQPILVGIFTDLEPYGSQVIADMSKIMAEYAIAHN